MMNWMKNKDDSSKNVSKVEQSLIYSLAMNSFLANSEKWNIF